ncbi:glycosyltransferase [Nitrosomonas sp. Nm166]|uniref:glycosyltransferase n=1 Tax=Nitrosomonas sp. Nm166 TaxID=1881054 RepID=UPI0008E9EAE6|nr:glycosyltransferase [Nitrosomonas sp. Nm166]SFE96518.1 Glycosyltransferase, GT2 family [Nitrosomonas sp. Nm166]
MVEKSSVVFPLVSIIIRSMDRSTLADALDSVASQTYPSIEVILVNAKGADHREVGEQCGYFPIRMVGSGEQLDRSRAANVGLDEATGEYLIFLDDDDLFYPEHIAVLVNALQNQNHCRCAYAGVRVEHYKEGVLRTTDLLNQPFHWPKLWGRNYIPIHAVLFERSLLNDGCRFDETLAVYEDWDFWVQMTQHTDFVHIDCVTACYRNYGHSGFGLETDKIFIRKAKGIYFNKWKSIWSGEQMSELIEFRETLLEQVQSQLHAQQAECSEYRQKLTEYQQAVTKHRQTITEHEQAITQYKQTIAAYQQEIAEYQRAIAEHKQEIAEHQRAVAGNQQVITEHQREIGKYAQIIHALYNSNSWKLTAPYRQVGLQARRISHVLALSSRFIKEHGGGWQGGKRLILKTGQRLLKEGPKGVRNGLRRYASYRPPREISKFIGASITRPELAPHTMAVDIVICVHNALEDVKKCLESVLRHTSPPYELILVDDGSGTETRDYLEHFAKNNHARLIRNESARGYTLAANQGIRASRSPYVMLLNSDTIVSAEWLDRMIACAESDPTIGIVGPLSNTASWQSIPDIEHNGDWSNNPLPAGMTVEKMAQQVAIYSGQLYPLIPFLNGFCLLIKRDLIDEIGELDEQNFAQGYGEENDYCFRTRQAGWSLAIADDVYIYHAQSKSYSSERRRLLCEHAGQVLARKYGQPSIDEGVYFCRYNRVLEGIRARAKRLFERHALIEKAQTQWKGKRIVFILPTREAGGGANVVISEAQALIKMGVDVWLLNFSNSQVDFENSYPELDIPVIYAPNEALIPKLCADFDAVIATFNTSVAWIMSLSATIHSKPILGYYIQDFEPYFYKQETIEHKNALASYTLIPDLVCVTKTYWNHLKVLENTGAHCTVLGPSIDIDLFRPRLRKDPSWPERPLRIAAMIRPSSPRRSPHLTMEILKIMEQKYRERIEIFLFGEESNTAGFLALPQDFAWNNLGKQTPERVALLLNEVDIFVDFSDYQAMGLTAMEAMACGVAVILPENGGASSFASHEKNALLVDTKNPNACHHALDRLISDNELRIQLQRQALSDITHYFPEAPAFKLLEALFRLH